MIPTKRLADSQKLLEAIYTEFHTSDLIGSDPLIYPYQLFKNDYPKTEVEFVAFTAAHFAYGNVKAIQGFLSNYFDKFGTDPFKLSADVSDNIYYRFQKPSDISIYNQTIREIYENHGDLESYFDHCRSTEKVSDLEFKANSEIKPSIESNKADFIKDIKSKLGDDLSYGLKMLFADPEKSGAKRLTMFLRWMIRRDNIDLGLWSRFSSSDLGLPLDTHILKFSKLVGILNISATSSNKSYNIVNEYFRKVSPTDPAKYDFSLTRPGVLYGCRYARHSVCEGCVVLNVCSSLH